MPEYVDVRVLQGGAATNSVLQSIRNRSERTSENKRKKEGRERAEEGGKCVSDKEKTGRAREEEANKREKERARERVNESLNVIVMEKLFNPPLTPSSSSALFAVKSIAYKRFIVPRSGRASSVHNGRP